MAHVEFNGSDCNKLKGNIGGCMGTVKFFSFHGILVCIVVLALHWAWALDINGTSASPPHLKSTINGGGAGPIEKAVARQVGTLAAKSTFFFVCGGGQRAPPPPLVAPPQGPHR